MAVELPVNVALALLVRVVVRGLGEMVSQVVWAAAVFGVLGFAAGMLFMVSARPAGRWLVRRWPQRGW